MFGWIGTNIFWSLLSNKAQRWVRAREDLRDTDLLLAELCSHLVVDALRIMDPTAAVDP